MQQINYFFRLSAVFLFVTFAMTSCEGGRTIYDFVNYSAYLNVSNASGDNLFDPSTENNLLNSKIYAIHKGNTYHLNADIRPQRQQTASADIETEKPMRMNMPVFEGLHVKKHYLTDELCLCFGELSPTDEYRNDTIEIHWPDESVDIITFDCFVSWKRQKPSVSTRFFLNGDLMPFYLAEVVK